MHTIEKHEFAFFYAKLSSLLTHCNKGSSLTISDEQLYYRIMHVVRLTAGETALLFDAHQSAHILLLPSPKKNVLHATVLETTIHKKLQLPITVMLPLLKREALEQALYSCVELGATTVQLVLTQKVQRGWMDKDFDRLTNVMIAAAEQSKNFLIPTLHRPILLQEAVEQLPLSSRILCCAIDGQPLLEIFSALEAQSFQSLVLLIGPEGDFVAQERDLLKRYNTFFCRLTPTVLRSQQALVIALGVVRSILR